MAESSSSTCAICLEPVQDARLLDCLHSFCKCCLDDSEVKPSPWQAIVFECPVCRSTTRLPKNGAAGLPRDITVAVDTTSRCHTCGSANREETPEVMCTTCDMLSCAEHALPHILANTGHRLEALPKAATSSSRPVPATSSAQQCEEHGVPKRYFCQQCNMTICGDCGFVGVHHGHQPIVPVKDIAKELKQRVRRKTDHMSSARLERMQTALSNVEDVSAQLSSTAESVRTRIRSSDKCLHDMVDLVMQQRLAEVDDLEELRLRHLNWQEDELKGHSDRLKSMIRFSEKVLEADAEPEDVFELLLAVEKRLDQLEKQSVEERPVEHARVDIESIGEETLLAKVNKLVGVVIPCHASATHSFVEGDTKQWCNEDAAVDFLVVAKDHRDRCLATGGDVVRAELHETTACPDSCPGIDIIDNNSGTYKIRCTARQHGDYLLRVVINGVNLQEHLNVICPHPVPFNFDVTECQAENMISEDKLAVKHTGRTVYASVLGSRGMKTGQHVWKVSLTSYGKDDIFLGVAEKPGLTGKRKNYRSTYNWNGSSGYKWSKGQASPSMNKWQADDVLELHLDCTEHTLSIKNLRSGETDAITDLPATELFAYFATRQTGDSLSLVP